MNPALAPIERISNAILLIRGERVLLDETLADLYQVPTHRLNEAVKRNLERFPEDFMFQLTEEEWANLISQSARSSSWGGRRKPPYAFSEYGVAMLSSVLRSERAILANIAIMRAFGQMHRVLATHHDLAKKLETLERNYDAQFRVVFEAIRQLMQTPTPKRSRIGFKA